jgi:hypothetical protein
MPAGTPSKKIISIGSFTNDTFFGTNCNYRHNYTARQNLSSSFDLKDFTCFTCTGEGHRVLHREGERVEARELTPSAFVLSDQNFAPSLPVEGGEGECLKIIRVEDATLQELATVFLEATRGFIMPAGSVVVLASASHLAWVGAATYAREYVAARLRLRAAFRGGIEVIHGVPLLVGGVEDCNGVWALQDFFSWLGHVVGGRDIGNTHHMFTDTLALAVEAGLPLASASTTGSSLTPEEMSASPSAAVHYNVSMPAELEKKESAIFEMRHDCVKDRRAMPFEANDCNNILESLIAQLNENYMSDLGPTYVAEQFAATEEIQSGDNPYAGIKFIFIGGSHANRLAVAADNAGIECINLTVPGLRINSTSIENLSILVNEEVEKEEDIRKIVVFQLYDNNTFFSQLEDGSKSLPVRCQDDNIYHIPGQLVIADHSVIKNLVNISTPLLRAAGNLEKVILSPLPRYLKKCCDDKSHLTNRRGPGFKEMLSDRLEDVRHSLQDLINGKKIKSFKVISPLDVVGEEADESTSKVKFWGSDPVHLTPSSYSELARAITDAAVSGNYKCASRADPSAAGAKAGLAKHNKNFKRQNWIATDDNTAHQIYPDHNRTWGWQSRGGSRGSSRSGPRGGGLRGSRGGRGSQHPHRDHVGPKKNFRGRGHRSWPY